MTSGGTVCSISKYLEAIREPGQHPRPRKIQVEFSKTMEVRLR